MGSVFGRDEKVAAVPRLHSPAQRRRHALPRRVRRRPGRRRSALPRRARPHEDAHRAVDDEARQELELCHKMVWS